MTEKDVTSQTNVSVTDDSVDSSTVDGSELQTKPGDELSDKTKVNSESTTPDSSDLKSKGEFINALGDKNKKLAEKDEKLSQLEKELAEYRKKEREKRLAEMSDGERLSAENAELKEKLYSSEILGFAKEQLSKTGLTDNAISEIAMTEPWLLPAVKKHLTSTEPSWEEVSEAVKTYLPEYLESLSQKTTKSGRSTETTQTETKAESQSADSNSSDAERSTQSSSKRIWKTSEISKMSTSEYAAKQQEIHKAMVEGRVV